MKFRKVNAEHQKVVSIVDKLLFIPLGRPKDFNWGKEIKIAKKLCKKYNDHRFWDNFTYEGKNSLVYYLSKEGLYKLDQKWNDFLISNMILKPVENIELSKELLGENLTVEKCGKSVLDYLN